MRRTHTQEPQALLDLYEQKAFASQTFAVYEVDEAISLLEAIETDAGPCGQGVLCVFRVFDLESVGE